MMKLETHVVVVDVILLMLDYAPSLPMDEMIFKGVPYLKFLVKGYLKKKRSLNKIINDKWHLFWKYFEE